MNVLIVHAHPEPHSFTGALAKTAAATLAAAGHAVATSDLYAMRFDPVSGRHNFTTVKDPAYFKQQQEEVYAADRRGFAPDLDAEMGKLEAADLLVFAYPLWWFGLPAMLKGWVDRVFASGRIYGGPRLYENGLGGGTKRGLVLLTTGAGANAYDGRGVNPALGDLLQPVEHGVFWFNGYRPLAPFVAHAPARMTADDRAATVERLTARLAAVFTEEPRTLPPLADFPNFGPDRQKRFVAVAEHARPVGAEYRRLVPAEIAKVAEWKRDGKLVAFDMAPVDAPDWKAFLHFRAPDRATVDGWLAALPLAGRLTFTVTELAAG